MRNDLLRLQLRSIADRTKIQEYFKSFDMGAILLYNIVSEKITAWRRSVLFYNI